MLVFISWSGNRSKYIAEALRTWLKDVIQSIEPWVSSEDIRKGDRWNIKVAKNLEKASFGILCLTRENLSEPWLLFEAGALAKTLVKSSVCPYLIGLKPSDLRGPLVQFQAAIANEAQTKKLVHSINKSQNEGSLTDGQIDRSFKRCWPDFEQTLRSIPGEESELPDLRSDRELLEEILNRVRQSSNQNNDRIYSFEQPVSNIPISFTENKDVLQLLNKAELLGQPGDPNEIIWSKNHEQFKNHKLDGIWSSRWQGGISNDSWVNGIGNVHVYGENFYAITRDNVGDCLIVTKKMDNNLIAGRYFNISEPREVLPWAGKIINNDRIDGYWSEGRWDLRRGVK